MNKRLNRTNRNYIIMGLCAILLIMGVGYAAFQSQLKISGTSNIATNFLVKITGIEVSSKSGGAADKPDVTTYNDTSATFGTTLQSPGDSITYDITIENQGTIDAVLKTISKTDASNSAILFETSGVNEGDPLNVGETATMQVKVTYNTSVTSQPGDLDSTLNVDLDYEQAGGDVTPPTPSEPITSEDLKDLVVNEGDGLYKDEYEDGRYIYKGANPNNNITFNNEQWKIISVESDGSIKIMKNENVGEVMWDIGLNNWEKPANINVYLNEEYLNTITQDSSKIVPHVWNIGGVVYNNNNLISQINDEKDRQSQSSSVGMITASEYLRANSNVEQCGTFNLNNTNASICKTTNWIYNIIPSGSFLWTISYNASTSGSDVFALNNDGMVANVASLSAYAVSPSLYLTSDITLLGDGSEGNPYMITN